MDGWIEYAIYLRFCTAVAYILGEDLYMLPVVHSPQGWKPVSWWLEAKKYNEFWHQRQAPQLQREHDAAVARGEKPSDSKVFIHPFISSSILSHCAV